MSLVKLLLSGLPKPHARQRYLAECAYIDEALKNGDEPILDGSIMPRLSERMRVAVYVRSVDIAAARGAEYPSAIDIFFSVIEDGPLLASLIAPETMLRLRPAASEKKPSVTTRRSSHGSISADAQRCLEWMVRDLPMNRVFDERHVVRALISRSSTGLKDMIAAENDATLRKLIAMPNPLGTD